jgi:hypothetical protein
MIGQSQVYGVTLRALINQAKARGGPLSLQEAVEIVVPLCVEAADLHAQGHRIFLHPSNIAQAAGGGYGIARTIATTPPSTPEDVACMAPEINPSTLGDARSTVYAVGAILYELVTLERVATGMRRPTEIDPSLPLTLETVLSKALVTDPQHRPDDLGAMAQAIHHLAAPGTIPPPPPADESHLDQDDNFEVDVSLSLLPPPPGAVPLQGGFGVGVVQAAAPPPSSSGDSATQTLAAVKARLESDPTPRYVVVKDGMDHGPFNAVELLQQITANTFVEEDELRDNNSGEQRTIRDWPDFALFAEHARRHRDIKYEKEAIVRVAAQETKATRGKAFIGVAVLGALLAIAGTWFLTSRGARSDEVAVQGETVTNIETEGNVEVGKRAGGKGRRVVGSQGGIPLLAGGMSCEGAQAAYVEEIKMGGGAQADITRGQYAGIMNNGSYLNGCGVPASTAVNICAAVQNGRAVGVTVVTKPQSGKVSSCIASKVRGIGFPKHPKLDVVRVSFAAQ